MSFKYPGVSPGIAMPSRRRFVQGLAAGGAVAGLGLWPQTGWAQQSRKMPVLRGTEFDLSVGETLVNYTGQTRPAVTINGTLPGPLLRWKEGTTVTLRVRNDLPRGSIHGPDTSIHWHGLVLPANMDGVPGMSFDGIRPGESYLYRFDVKQAGTYWYHSHTGLQEQRGVYGSIVIEPMKGARVATPGDAAFYEVFLIRRSLAGLMAQQAALADSNKTKSAFVAVTRALPARAEAAADGHAFAAEVRKAIVALIDVANTPRTVQLVRALTFGHNAFQDDIVELKKNRLAQARLWAKISNAVEAGDANTARDAMEAIFDCSRAYLESARKPNTKSGRGRKSRSAADK